MPNRLSTQLCKLFDGGYTTVKEFARLSNESPRTIEWIANRPGALVDRETEFRIGKVLAGFKRKFPEITWDLEPRPRRRIVEEETHRGDERRFTLYNSEGRWCGTWECPVEDVDDGMLEYMDRYLARKDANKLKLMRDGA
jgi:hypothetical protein